MSKNGKFDLSADVFRGVEDESEDAIPPPPYMLSGADFVFCGVRYSAETIRKLLPAELKPQPDLTGTFGIYEVRHGWGIAPWSAFFASIEVEDYDSPDGTPGYFMAAGFYSDRAGVVMRRDYNMWFRDGLSRQKATDGVIHATGGTFGYDAVTMQIRRVGDVLPSASGIHHYIGQKSDSSLTSYTVAFTCNTVWNSVPISIQIDEGADARLRALRPEQVLWGLEFKNVSMTFSAPKQLVIGRQDTAGDLTSASALKLFSHLGRAAIVTGSGGRVHFMNAAAEELAQGALHVRNAKLFAMRKSDQDCLDQILHTAIAGGRDRLDLAALVVPRDRGRTLIVRALPIDASLLGKPVALLLLSDPSRDVLSDPEPALRLMGLTHAESRVAALVGAGRSPKQAAREIGNSEGTVRKTLAGVYQKLFINKQSELARIVTRLETIVEDSA